MSAHVAAVQLCRRKVHLSNFKGKVYLGVREFYEDKMSGELKPGQKVCHLRVQFVTSAVSAAAFMA